MVRSLAGGWQLGITTFYAGVPFASLTANCNPPNAAAVGADYNPSFTGPVRINGGYGSGDLLAANAPAFLDKNAFVSPDPSHGNTPTNAGLHNPNTYTESLSLRRNSDPRRRKAGIPGRRCSIHLTGWSLPTEYQHHILEFWKDHRTSSLRAWCSSTLGSCSEVEARFHGRIVKARRRLGPNRKIAKSSSREAARSMPSRSMTAKLVRSTMEKSWSG
jgi:hypothetical protein